MSTAMETFGLPPGRYPATLTEVEVTRHGKSGPWFLDMVSKVTRNGRDAVESRKLGRPEAYELTKGQRKTLLEVAGRLGVQDSGPAEEIVASIKELVGAAVTAYVRPDPLGGVACTLYARNGHEPVSGEVLDRMPAVEPEYTERTVRAQGAHEQLLTGLHHANRGLALAASACHRLRLEEGWAALGYTSVGAYLASPEIAISRTQFYALADIWEQYIEQGGQDELRLCAPSKLEVPLPALKAGEVTAEQALEDAETLALRDLRVKYRGEPEPSGRPERPPSFPFGCAHCGALIESTAEIVERHPEAA